MLKKNEMRRYNSNVTRRVNGTDTPVKEGVVADNNTKTSMPSNTVGVNIGGTMNMGNYESLRIDVWSTDTIRVGETRQQAVKRVAHDLEQVFVELRNQYAGTE